jgi:hypothetical protein
LGSALDAPVRTFLDADMKASEASEAGTPQQMFAGILSSHRHGHVAYRHACPYRHACVAVNVAKRRVGLCLVAGKAARFSIGLPPTIG